MGQWLTTRHQDNRKNLLSPTLKADIEAAVGPHHAARLWEPREVRMKREQVFKCAAFRQFVRRKKDLPKRQDKEEYEGTVVR